MPKNYYVILGVSRDSDLNQIKKAYRKTVKKYHPDITHSENNKRFRELQEAYETLADGRRRRQYDSALAKQESLIQKAGRLQTNYVPEPPPTGLDSFESIIEEFFEGFIPGINRPGPSSGICADDLYFEVILSPMEALRGGLFPIRFDVTERCPVCSGSGFNANLICAQCDGRGGVGSERELTVSIPPRTADGTRVTLSLEDVDLRGVSLHLLVRVDPLLSD